MGMREEVSGGVADALGPIADHIVNSLFLGLGFSKEKPLLAQLSGKSIEISVGGGVPITIKIPNLPQPKV
jgi:hypothetical protein